MNIEQLIQLSPVPVEFVNYSDFAGTYYKVEGCIGKPYIEINNELNNHQKIAALIHEIGHAKCDIKNCKCMKNPDPIEREIHATKFMLSWLLKHKRKEILEQEIKDIIRQAAGYFCHEYYTKAAKHIMKLKLWQKCLDYVK